jgi:predicted pyridoxine 5'-phosphate oxidase superfamily flavin-nucleotide-binding protein
MTIPQSVRDLIATGPLAHITTLNQDGSPHVTVVWLGTEGDEFVMGHMGVWQKIKNIRRDLGWRSHCWAAARTRWGCRSILWSTVAHG